MCTVLGDRKLKSDNLRPMARKRKTGLSNSDPSLTDQFPGGSAEDISFARPRLLSPLSPLPSTGLNDPLSEVEDRRSFHPQGRHRPALYSTGPLKVKDRSPSKLQRRFGFAPRSQTKGVLTFANPSNVVLCVRRKTRREVLFATRRNGAGGRRPRRRNWTTQISCR